MTMAETLTVRPAAGRRVRYPTDPTRVLPEAGAVVPADSYWMRRVAEGDVEVEGESK